MGGYLGRYLPRPSTRQDQVHPPPGTRYTSPLGPGNPPRTRYTQPPPGPDTPLEPGTPLPLGTRYTHPLGPGTPPRTRYTPGTKHTPPRDRYTHPQQCMLEDMGNKWAVRIHWNAFLFTLKYRSVILSIMGDKPIQPVTIDTMLNCIMDRYFKVKYRAKFRYV